uniref:Uncharacterized protein n=1 Tax=Timema cristinae TaxID=61476 RepID=A0A7R9CDV7_TIMCR|nr:unnamed protein product [Timema cristinae]
MDFTDFTLDNDTEALLSKHQTYLDALQKYYSTNETFFKELELLIQLQNKFEASQLLLLDSTRLFRNRGGALLKEEKDRQLTKKLVLALGHRQGNNRYTTSRLNVLHSHSRLYSFNVGIVSASTGVAQGPFEPGSCLGRQFEGVSDRARPNLTYIAWA